MNEWFLDLPPDRMDGEVVVALFFEDDRPLRGAAALLDWRLNGRLTELLLEQKAAGALGDTVICSNNGKLESAWALLVGGGSRQRLSQAIWVRLVKRLFDICAQAGFQRLALCLDDDGSASTAEVAGIVDGVRQDPRYQQLECLLTFVKVASVTRPVKHQPEEAVEPA